MTGGTLPEHLDLMRSSRWKVLVKPVGLASLLAVMTGASSGVE